MIYVYLQFIFWNRNLITMERIIRLSFSSTGNDDCGLPYLCSNFGCNETQPVYQQSYVALPVFKAVLVSQSSTRDGRSHEFFSKKIRWWNGFDFQHSKKAKPKRGQSVSVHQSRSFTRQDDLQQLWKIFFLALAPSKHHVKQSPPLPSWSHPETLRASTQVGRAKQQLTD